MVAFDQLLEDEGARAIADLGKAGGECVVRLLQAITVKNRQKFFFNIVD